MFCSLIQSKYPPYNQPPTSISLSYTSLPSLSPIPSLYHSILTLSLNHCQLSSLTHIDQFPSLQHLSIKYNNITTLQQLYKIKNKQTIKSLDFRGNEEIEYLCEVRIEKMRERFEGLVELNGVDYRFMGMKGLGAGGKKEVEMGRVLHRLDTLGAMLESMNRSEDHPSNKKYKDHYRDSRVMTSQQKSRSPSRSRSVSRDKQNRQQQLPTVTQRRKQLQISTGNIDPLNHQTCQPTATFAKQKQIQQKTNHPIGFKKGFGALSRIQRKSEHSMDISLMMKYNTNTNTNSNNNYNNTYGNNNYTNTYPNMNMVNGNNNFETSNQSGLFPDLNEKVNENKEDLAEAHYSRNLAMRTFYAWADVNKYSTNGVVEDRPFKREWPSLLN